MRDRSDPVTLVRWLRRIYAFSMFALLLRYLVLLVFFSEPYSTPVWILGWQVLTAGAGILLGKRWKSVSFWILVAYLLLLFGRVWFDDPTHLLNPGNGPSVSEVLLHGFWVVGACCSLGSVLEENDQRRFLRALAAVWTVGMVLHSIIALYAAWNGRVVWNPVHGAFWGLADTIGEGGAGFMEQNAVGSGEGLRLTLILYCTVSGAILSLSGMIALCAALCEKKWWVKVLYFLAIAVYLFAMGLTDTRACHLSFSAGAGAAGGILLLRALRKRHQARQPDVRKIKKPLLAMDWALAFTLAAVVMVACVVLISATVPAFNRLQSADGVLLPVARAEETSRTPVVVSSRGYSGGLNKVLSARVVIWEGVVRYIREHPVVLLEGESIWIPMRGVNTQTGLTKTAGHPHCAPMYILLESGIPGLLLIAAVLGLAVIRSFRLAGKRETPLWLALLPAVFLSLCVGDLVECICGFLGYPYPNCSALFLVMGMLLRRRPAPSLSPEGA